MLMSQVVVALFSPCFLLFFAAFYRLARPHLLDRFDASSSACRNLFFLFNFALRFCTVFFCCLPVVLLVLCMPQIMFGTPLTPLFAPPLAHLESGAVRLFDSFCRIVSTDLTASLIPFALYYLRIFK